METPEGRKQYLITGHSLGGGLASALSLMTGINAVTFNAAGLHQYTIEEIGRIFAFRHKQMQEYNPQITAYQVDCDILSRLQGRTRIKFFSGDNIPNAYGTIYPLTSQYRSDAPLFVNNMVNMFQSFGQGLQNLFNFFRGLPLEEKRFVNVGITCHSMNQVIYGMLYSLNLQTNGHDAFGYPEEYGFRIF